MAGGAGRCASTPAWHLTSRWPCGSRRATRPSRTTTSSRGWTSGSRSGSGVPLRLGRGGGQGGERGHGDESDCDRRELHRLSVLRDRALALLGRGEQGWLHTPLAIPAPEIFNICVRRFSPTCRDFQFPCHPVMSDDMEGEKGALVSKTGFQ